jgi:hypothetical protein
VTYPSASKISLFIHFDEHISHGNGVRNPLDKTALFV